MAIRLVRIKDFLVFQGEFSIEFSENINVIIGENGAGKTSLLKTMYAAEQLSDPPSDLNVIWKLANYFSPNADDPSALFKSGSNGYFEVYDGDEPFFCKKSNDSIAVNGTIHYSIEHSVFIPTTEMLSHSKGFLALNQKFRLPFDGTQVDIIVNASLPEMRETLDVMPRVVDKISSVIDGTVIQENDVFYIIKNDGKKIEFSLEAEGLRKLGLIWKLIRNGLLDKETILFWDEPEANLNPELYSLVAEILLELQSSGVQIFVATHSYNFAKYLEIRRSFEEQVRFHNLYKDESGAICSTAASTMEDLKQNHIMIADEKLLDEVYDM